MVIVVTGASGLIGSVLVPALEADGHDVCCLVRRPIRDANREIYWDPAAQKIDAAELNGVDAVVHLAGQPIACRWTATSRAEILDSRVQGTRLLANTLGELEYPPQVLVSSSAIGFYGDRGDELLSEESPAGQNFVASVCQAWEQATQPASDAGIRTVHLRTGIVLSPAGGALAQMLTPFRLGLGGVLGNGSQFMSWIHLEDEIAAIRHTIDHPSLEGAVNLVAENPVTNRQFTKTLGRALNRPTLFPIPAFAARLAFGKMADELLLASARVVPARLQQAGYQFRYPELPGALSALLE